MPFPKRERANSQKEKLKANQTRAIMRKKEGDFIFGELIKKILNEYKKDDIVITQKALADCLGISRQSFNSKMHLDSFTAKEMVKIGKRMRFKIILRTDDGTEYELKEGE